MRVLFQPYPMPDGTARPAIACEVLAEHPDGLASLRLDLPGGPPAMVLARRGGGPGEWLPMLAAPEPAPLQVLAPVRVKAPKPKPPDPAPAASLEPASTLQTCKMCFKRHRGDDYMYCDDCNAAGVPTGGARRGKY